MSPVKYVLTYHGYLCIDFLFLFLYTPAEWTWVLLWWGLKLVSWHWWAIDMCIFSVFAPSFFSCNALRSCIPFLLPLSFISVQLARRCGCTIYFEEMQKVALLYLMKLFWTWAFKHGSLREAGGCADPGCWTPGVVYVQVVFHTADGWGL